MDMLNIIVCGEAGVGKSSVIDLITGRNIAGTFLRVPNPGLMSFKTYDFRTDRRDILFWEAVALRGMELRHRDYLAAIPHTFNLIHDLVQRGGVDLLLFCIRGDHPLTAATQNSYRLFYQALCGSKVPVVLIVTHLESEDNMDVWWLRNLHTLKSLHLECAGHACITGLRGHRRYSESQAKMEKILNRHARGFRFTMPPDEWFAKLLPSMGGLAPLKEHVRRAEVQNVLENQCGLHYKVAQTLVTSWYESTPWLSRQKSIQSPPLNVILFGETGANKSSILELIVGSGISPNSSHAQGATFTSTMHTRYDLSKPIKIWETAGLVEPCIKPRDYFRTIGQACDFIRGLETRGGPGLLLLCIHADGITETIENNYKIFYEMLCMSQVPIALVITHVDAEEAMESWCAQNAETLEKKGLKFAGCACMTQASIAQLLVGHTGGQGFSMSPTTWIREFLRSFSQFAPKRGNKDIVLELLTGRCELGQRDAEKIAPMLLSEPFNVILFGETGVGKSSVINLIAGKPVAETTPDVLGCTMDFKTYEFEVGDQDIRIWDTVGLEMPTTGAASYLPAISNTFDLIQDLTSRGGVDLLLFCIRGGRITATTQSNYRLFYEVLCRSKVPIAIVVTHLEREPDMEAWWKRNEGDLEGKYGIKSAGHACITGLPQHARYQESRHNMQRMFEGLKGTGKSTMPPDQWFIEFLRCFGLFAPPLSERAQRKEVLKVLKTQCQLDPKIVEELADVLQGNARGQTLKDKTKDPPYQNLTSDVKRRTEPSAQRGDTWKCEWMKGNTPRIVALKVSTGLNAQKKYRVDLSLRATLSDSRIVPLLGIVDSEEMKGLVTPWYNNGSLSEYLKNHPELSMDQKKGLISNILVGLRYLQNQGVVHGNLHSNNVLIGDDLTARLTDFSFTLPRKFVGSAWLENCDALRFADPILIVMAQKSPDSILSPTQKCDIYSLGGLMLHIFFGTKPFANVDKSTLSQKLLRGERSEIPDPGESIPVAYKELIQECWSPQEFRRPLVTELIKLFGFQ